MAHVSIRWSKDADATLKYVQKERGDQDVTSTSDCTLETSASDFESVRGLHGKQDGNQALHVVQSFDPKDSGKLTPEEFNDVGRRLAEENFPGHAFVIRTHTDREHIHNHIVVNTVHSETGRKIENKRALIPKLRESSDKLCQEYGLSIINPEAHERRARLPVKVQQMVRAGKQSYIFDLVQKANVARSIATNFDEYRDTLSGLGIRTVIEEKNISYFYPGKEKGKRGSKLGLDYDKSGLVEIFKANDQKFAASPGLKAALLSKCSEYQLIGMPKTPPIMSRFSHLQHGDQALWKHYDQYTKVSRRDSKSYHSDRELLSAFVPASEIGRAKQGSILDYCKRHKIALTSNERGETVFKGKEFVTVTDSEFKNGRNGTRGSLINLVAAHKNMTLLQAVAHINSNSKLLLLEQHAGEVKHSYRSFYVPKSESGSLQKGTEKIAHLLKSWGSDPKLASTFQNRKMTHVDQSGSVWFFAKDDTSSALEFTETTPGKWTKTVHGKTRRPFYASAGNHSKVLLSTNPETLTSRWGAALFSEKKRSIGVLGLLEPNEQAVHVFVNENPRVKIILLAPARPGQPTKVELDLFNNLKQKYKKFQIGVELVSDERELKRTLERGRSDFGLSL